MKDILFLLVMGLIVYVVARLILKEPILPWKEKKNNHAVKNKNTQKHKKSQSKKEDEYLEEVEAAPFKGLFPHIHSIENHMIRHKDNTFSMMAEVEPVNYFLLDQEEQEGIDAIFETWLAQINYPVRIYLQNRFVDLTLPIQDIQSIMHEEDDLHPLAKEFGQNMINNLKQWQFEQPRYETKRYLIFDYKVDPKDIRYQEHDELETKMIDKAFDELNRRISTAQQQLRKADMHVHMLATDGICEVLYYGFNRRKAVKNHYRDIEKQEQLSLYVTADQPASYIVRVKGEIENAQKDIEKTEERTAS